MSNKTEKWSNNQKRTAHVAVVARYVFYDNYLT